MDQRERIKALEREWRQATFLAGADTKAIRVCATHLDQDFSTTAEPLRTLEAGDAALAEARPSIPLLDPGQRVTEPARDP